MVDLDLADVAAIGETRHIGGESAGALQADAERRGQAHRDERHLRHLANRHRAVGAGDREGAVGKGDVGSVGLHEMRRKALAALEVRSCGFIAKKIYSRVTWSVVFVNAEAQAELDSLPLDTRASFERIVRLVQALGLERVREPYIKHIEGPIWEMRLRGRGGIARALYVTATGRRVVILRVFTKKTQKTPRREIELARRRAEEVT